MPSLSKTKLINFNEIGSPWKCPPTPGSLDLGVPGAWERTSTTTPHRTVIICHIIRPGSGDTVRRKSSIALSEMSSRFRERSSSAPATEHGSVWVRWEITFVCRFVSQFVHTGGHESITPLLCHRVANTQQRVQWGCCVWVEFPIAYRCCRDFFCSFFVFGCLKQSKRNGCVTWRCDRF